MTIHEFEAWVSDHYEELTAASCRMTRRDGEAVSLLHEAIESVCEGKVDLPDLEAGPRLVGWLMRVVRFKQMAAYEKAVNYTGLIQRVADEVRVLGPEDAFVDTAPINARKKSQKYKAKKAAARAGDQQIAPLVEFTGRIEGSIRWRYQTLRDDRLFDERAIRSLSESMHKASQRIRHDGEPGFSYTEFGAENGQAWSAQENAR